MEIAEEGYKKPAYPVHYFHFTISDPFLYKNEIFPECSGSDLTVL